MTFGAPYWFWGLLVIPVLVLIFARAEKRGAQRLREFVAPRLLPQLTGTVDRSRRIFRFALQLVGLGCAIVALAQPRWGYTYQDVKRKGLDLLIAVDTSRSMLSNDVQPNRLGRVKLATQDLLTELTGDRVGLIAFAGRAFVQAPLTIDYDAVVQSITELDTKTIPEGGTNISEAIGLAVKTFGKSAGGNRALLIFTDGEELSGDALKAAKIAADNGVRTFTIGVGTPQGALIPVSDESGGTSFVKDESGQVVKSKLDENRLRQIAQETGGIYLHLENGPRTMKQLINEGLSKMKAAEMDVRLSRRPIERYEWPLGLAILALTASVLVAERKRARARLRIPQFVRATAPAAAVLLLIYSGGAEAAVPGVNLYNSGKFSDAYQSFDQDLRSHPNSGARDRIQFDAGTAAYKIRDYDKALQSFSNALLSKDPALQERSHYNIGRTLEERADMAKSDDTALNELEDAESHYEDALKIDPKDEAAKNNLEEVRKKIERLKNKKPSPTPPPQSQQQQKNKNRENNQQNQSQNQQSQQNQEQQSQSQSRSSAQNQNSQPQNQQQQSPSQNQQNNQSQSQQFAKNQPQKNQQPRPGESPSPSEGKQNDENQKSSGEQQPNQPPTPSGGENESPSPAPGEGEQGEPSATPAGTPRKPGGELKAAPDQESNGQPVNAAQSAPSESPRPEEMTPREAEELLRSMKDEEARVQLDERRARRTVYKDW